MTAAVRKTPTQANGGVDDGIDYTNLVDAEIEAVWKVVPTWLINIGGTPNAVTATSDTALVAAIASYARPMAFWYSPPASFGNNTTAVTFNIDGVGIINCKDQFGAALQGGEFNGGTSPGVYPLVFDGTSLRAITVTAGAVNRPVTQPDILAQEQQTSGTNGHSGATFTAGAYRQRFLTNLVLNDIGATLATNQITLAAGILRAMVMPGAYRRRPQDAALQRDRRHGHCLRDRGIQRRGSQLCDHAKHGRGEFYPDVVEGDRA